MQTIILSFKSFRFSPIKSSYYHIHRAMRLWKIPLDSCKFCSAPTRRKKFTLLKSPHVHKKSREQFEWSRRKAQLLIPMEKPRHLLLFLFLLRNSQFPGVELKITLNHRSSLCPRKIDRIKENPGKDHRLSTAQPLPLG